MTAASEFEESLRQRLSVGGVLSNLVRASAVITAYELLKEQIVGEVKSFFTYEWHRVDGQPIGVESEEYRERIVSRPMNKVSASLEWLVEAQAITQSELEVVERLQAERHRMAHEIGQLLIDPNVKPDDDLVRQAAGVSRSLARFWGSVTVDTDPAFDGTDVDYDKIESGISLLLGYLAELSAGSIEAFERMIVAWQVEGLGDA